MRPALARIRNAISRHRGWRGFSLALAFSVMLVAWPQLDLHSHANGEQTHSHALEHDDHNPPDPADFDAPGVIHLHDASSVAWTLQSCQPQIAAVPRATWNLALTFDLSAVAALPPPHRPPIA